MQAADTADAPPGPDTITGITSPLIPVEMIQMGWFANCELRCRDLTLIAKGAEFVLLAKRGMPAQAFPSLNSVIEAVERIPPRVRWYLRAHVAGATAQRVLMEIARQRDESGAPAAMEAEHERF